MKLSSIVKFFLLRVINMRDFKARHIILFLLLLNSFIVSSQDGSFRPSRTEAEATWNLGNYEAAFQHYNGLLLLYSRDPLYKYYTGACLVKLERDVSRAVTLLASAINSSVNVKTVPDEVWFYYGRALQMNGSFSQAADAYGRFIRTAGKKSSQALEVQKYLDQCDKGQGKLSAAQIALNTGRNGQDPGQVAETTRPMAQNEVKVAPVIKPVSTTQAVADKPVSLPEEYDTELTKALKMQYAADSLNRLAKSIRREMETAAAREPLLHRAEKLEKDAAEMQAEADRILVTLEPSGEVEVKAEAETEAKVEIKAEAEAKAKPGTGGEGQVKNVSEAVFSVFEVRSSQANVTNDQIFRGSDASRGLVYRVQLAAFKNPLPPGYFKGLYPLYSKINPANGITYYYAGMFRTLEPARQALPKVRAAGFNDAFVVAMMDDTQISMERAALLEKEWGRKPLNVNKPEIPGTNNISSSDSIPVGTLSFRAEVLRSKKPVSPEVAQKIALLSGSRGLDVIKNNQGETLYLIGNFITFESAAEYVSLLIRNGYSTARVVAYVGTQEIPVESARELLKKLQND